MKTKRPDPQRLDVMAFAAEGGLLQGRWPLMTLARLAESAAGGVPVDAEVDWRAAGQRKARTGVEPQTWLHLVGRVALPMQCQRCLQPVMVPLAVDTRIRFVRTEAEAAELDAETEHDVLAAAAALDLRELIEDELLMALPYVPRHDHCPAPTTLQQPASAAAEAQASAIVAAAQADSLANPASSTYRPFEALKGWKPG